MRDFVITSESLTLGHPDKLCDQISDAVIDAYLAEGVRESVIAECAIASGVAFLSVRSPVEAPVDLGGLARRVLGNAGYGGEGQGKAPTVMLEMSRGTAGGGEGRAGVETWRMVTAFGYACDQTANAMPYPVALSHDIARRLDAARIGGRLSWLSPDAQVQVAARFEDRRPVSLRAVAVTCGTLHPVTAEAAQSEIEEVVLEPALERCTPGMDAETRVVVMPSDDPAGPERHSGLTGRKSADDAYGSFVRRGGPALSGKDPSRADRVCVYAAREAARAIVSADLAREAEVQLSYIGGDEAPASIEVDTYGSGRISDQKLAARLSEVTDFRIGAIAERMRLWDLPGDRGGSFYRRLATYGHLGRDDLQTPWDISDLAHRLA